jgi:hypothetical protein
MRALRKRNISLFLACHGYTDIDGRIRPKVMYRIYMKGACAPSESLVWKTAPITLPQGKYYIERDAWGWARFNKIDEQPRVLVVLKQDDDDEEMRSEDQLESTDEPVKKDQVEVIRKDEVVFPVGIEDLPIKIDRQPGEFEPVGPDEDAIPEEFEIIDTDDEFVLKAPDKSSQPVSAPVDAPKEIPDEEQVEFRAPDTIPIDEIVEEPEQPDKKVINNVKPEDPLKDLYD